MGRISHLVVAAISGSMLVLGCQDGGSDGPSDRSEATGEEGSPSGDDPSDQPPAGGGVGSSPTGPARIFYTDLISGPNQGGEKDAGAFVTIWGRRFGPYRGSSAVTIGGGAAADYRAWSDSQVIVQLGPNAKTGDIVVQTPEGNSNGLPFVVRPGAIYFVTKSGDDGNDGSFASPWRTVLKVKNTIAPGDIAYLMDGVSQTREDMFDAALSIESSGKNGAPKALVAYPGAKATIGSDNLEFGLRVPDNPTAAKDWVVAKLILRGRMSALSIGGQYSSRWRVVGNDISCPKGDGQTGCFAASLASYVAFLGNDVHDTGKQSKPAPSKQYHAVYFTTDTNHVEVGWNHIHDNVTCRAIQFHSSPLEGNTGLNQFDLSVHDNLIHGDVCDGINFATVDPSKGPVRAFNNVIYNVGRGPNPPDGDADYACIYVAAGTNTGPDGKGEVEIFNNTLYDCGARKNESSGAFNRGEGSPGLVVNLQNNLVYVINGESYFAEDALKSTGQIKGTNNLWFGGGALPTFLTGNVTGDPRLADVKSFDFHLVAGSPAIDAGATASTSDFDGIGRPQGRAPDIGAYEFSR